MDVNRDEERKIAEIFKERKSTQNSDNRSEKVDFLYKDKVDSEEYLLGKRVDTHFERQNIPQGSQSNVGAKFDEDPFLHNERLNTQIKQREDPLSAMRKKEEDARRALLNNPLKMKLLEKELKERRKKRRSKDGDELLARLMAIKGGKVNAKPVKAKRKLPDDDQSLLYRYLELIGKTKRYRFYDASSDEEDSRKLRKHRKHDTSNKDSSRKDRNGNSASGNVKDTESSWRKTEKYDDSKRTTRTHSNDRQSGSVERRSGRARYQTVDNERSRNEYHSSHRDRHGPSERSGYAARADHRSQDRSARHGRRESDRSTAKYRRSRSRSNSIHRYRNSRSRSKEIATKRVTQHISSSKSKPESSTSKPMVSSSPEVANRVKSERKVRSSNAVENQNLKKAKSRRSQSVSSSSSSSSSGSNSSSSSGSNSSFSSSPLQGAKRRKKSTPKKRSSRDRAAHSRSSSADSNHSLKHLERERNELKDKLSMLPSYGLVHPKGESVLVAKADSDAKRKSNVDISKKKLKRSPSPTQSTKSSHKQKELTKAEKEAKLNEMMDNAKWRDEQRSKNVARYKKEQEEEDEMYAKNAGKDNKFIAPMMTSHAGDSSIEDQLRRNRHKIQRNTAATEKNFARK